jgi:hypothetical protein
MATLSNTTFNIPTISDNLYIYSSNITATNLYTPTTSNVEVVPLWAWFIGTPLE